MTAFGLSDMAYAKALITKVLEGGTSSSSFAASLNDPRYLALVSALNFQENGAATTSSTTAQQTTVNNYYEQTLETNAAQENQGAQMALYFQRMAPNITTAYSILADKTLLKVVETAFNLPSTLSLENIDTQAKEISQLLNVSKLQDPTYLHNFIERFTASYDAQNPLGQSSTPTNAMLVSSPGISSESSSQSRQLEARRFVNMQSGPYVSLSAQLTLERRLEALAINVANMNTVGYRAAGVSFHTYVSRTGRSAGRL